MSERKRKAETLHEELGAPFLAAILASRGKDARYVETVCGWRNGLFCEMRSRGFPSPEARALMENRLGWIRIWSDSRTFMLREAFWRKYGADPALLSLVDLRTWTRKLELTSRLSPQANREQLIEALLSHMAPSAGK